jgi:hypothetical protein
MEILKRLVKVQVKGRRKLLDKEQNDYGKCTRALDLWGSDTHTGAQSHWIGMSRGICWWIPGIWPQMMTMMMMMMIIMMTIMTTT